MCVFFSVAGGVYVIFFDLFLSMKETFIIKFCAITLVLDYLLGDVYIFYQIGGELCDFGSTQKF